MPFYQAVQQQLVQDNTVRSLAESLHKMVDIANTCRDLIIGGASNIIEEIGRACLQVASLIHEYTKSPLTSDSAPIISLRSNV